MSLDVKKTLYNKQQLTYLENRIDVAIQDVMQRWDNAHPEPDEITDDEKYEQIARGVAKLRPWSVLRNQYRDMRTDIEDAYEFVDPRKEMRDACQEHKKEFELRMLKLRRKAEELIYLGDQTQLLAFIESIEDMQR